MPARSASIHWLLIVGLLLVLAIGTWLRIPGEKHRARKGADEGYYERYMTELGKIGILSWPDLVEGYIERQKTAPTAFLPPTRVLFLASAVGWQSLTNASSIEAVRGVSCLAGILTLYLGTVFAWRLGGATMALGVSALLACSPLLIHLSHRALIDGYFAFWAMIALWGLWECLRAPGRRRWLALYGTGLAAMVLTKENAAFAFLALGAVLIANRWLNFGHVTRELLIVTFLAPALAGAILIVSAGGLQPLLEAYRLNVQKSVVLPYAIATGDGPWHRYLLDFLLVSPAITLLATAAIGATPWTDPAKRYFVVFIVVSYAIMASIRYGMNLRYGAMWVLPLCWLAFTLLTQLSAKFTQRWQHAALVAFVAIACTAELRNYYTLFVASDVYDPVPGALIQAAQISKRDQPKP